jgi:signal transduction histidine kinase
MRFAPRLSVGAQLTVAVILIVLLSWTAGGFLFFRLFHGRERPGTWPAPGGRVDVSQSVHRGAEKAGSGAASTRAGQDEDEAMRVPPPGRPPLRRILLRDSAQLIIAVLLSLVAGALLSRRFTRPLARLAEGARALRSGHLDYRIPVKGDDEFGRVAVSMNEMAERISQQIAALEADAHRRRQLLADVAHELRSPVATLKTMAEAVRDGLATQPERGQRASQAMVDSADRMERLVNDLVELARLDLHELPLECRPVDLRALAADRLRAHGEAAAQAGMTIHPVEEGAPVAVEGDRYRLEQVLDNLVDNAISHAGPGAEVRVTVMPGDPVTVTVADTGRGISAAHLPYVFDPFYRVDSARTPGDHHIGLGLRIARGLAEAHGGALRVDSAEAQGTRAILTLPRQCAGPSATTARMGDS